MAINFPDSPSNGDTYTAAGKTFIYNSTKGSWAAASSAYTNSDVDAHLNTSGAATDEFLQWSGSDYQWSVSGVKTYATIDDLPLSGQSNGAQAFVTGTNRLYIWSASTANSSYEGWFNIALVNTNPSLSGATSDYALATDGSTPTVVTLASTDPEGVPVTYSIASDTSGDIATVVQGTGANTNVFTITPTSNTSVSGTFSLTFKASDGINIVQTSSNFTLQFTILNSKYTTALITSVGANLADNNDFVDSSTSNHTITAIGNVTQNTFSPYRHGGYSTYFDGSGDYLSIADATSLRLGSGEFTVEFWIYMTSLARTVFVDKYDGTSAGWQIQYRDYNNVNHIAFSTNAGHYATTPSDEIEANTWYHVAALRDSSDAIKIYINGVEKGSSTSYTQDLNGTTAVNIGVQTYNIAAGYMNGYIADVRIVKGTAITPSFSGPDSRLTAVTNTSLLTCHLPYIADGSTNSHAITVNGNTKTEPFSPYAHNGYSSGSHGGSMYFDGTGDRITFSHASDFSFGTGDFTIEFWIKTPTNAITGGYSRTICEIGQLSVYMRITTYHGGVDSAIRVYDESADIDVGNLAIANDLWHHVAIVRESGTMKCWVDGKYNTGVSNSKNLSETSTNTIGGRTDGNGHIEGTLVDFRVVKGTAVYTGTDDFVPPTEPLTAITNTSLLLSGTNAGIIDKSQSVKTITLNGDVKSSTTQTKYLSSSMYFDGSSDYISAPYSSLFDLGTQDFTVELWANFSAASGNIPLVQLGQGGSSASTTGWAMVYQEQWGGLMWYRYNGSSETYYVKSWSPSTNTWYHIAVSRQGTDLRFFVDGTSIGTQANVSTSYNNINTSDDLWIGRNRTGNGSSYLHFNGYMSDVRITKGLARYTAADETANIPSAALQG